MGASSPQAAWAGPTQLQTSDLQSVRGNPQSTDASKQAAQQSSHVPQHSNIHATQTFFDPAPTTAYPAPVAQGHTMGAMNPMQPLYCPAQQEFPVFLGARVGHSPILLHCGACNYQGMTTLRQARGWAHGMWAMMTLGLGFFVPVAMDTNHFCPQCGKHVAVAKLM